MADRALLLKEEGNKHFQEGSYKKAESFYTQAIEKDPRNPKLFTNRAMTRVRLESWNDCIDDCLKSIEIEPGNMKGYYYLAQAHLALNHPNEALNSAVTAYEECLRTNSSSTNNVSSLVLMAKMKKWEAKERDRIRRRSALLAELEDGLGKVEQYELHNLKSRVMKGEVGNVEAAEEKEEIEENARKKIEELRTVFAISDPENLQRREIPEYLIDNITFGIMHDPVLTKNGQSYDRSTMLEHLKRSETDPLTREYLRVEDLRPNLALRQACEEFLEKNGWAVDW